MNEFRSYFERYGEIVDIAIISDKKTRSQEVSKGSKGFGFVSFKSVQSARNVIRDYDIHKFRDRWVECKMSYPKEAGGDFQFEDQSPTSHSPIQNRSRGQLSNGYPHGGNSYSPITTPALLAAIRRWESQQNGMAIQLRWTIKQVTEVMATTMATSQVARVQASS